jgi:asparagine synthetase B (glutamine-hydrolysing)
MARALTIRRQGNYFLRGGVLASLSLVGEEDVVPRAWGGLNRLLYQMFHSTVLPTILRNFDRVSMAHGVEVRMPFMDWRLVTCAMVLPDDSKLADGQTKMIARRAMQGRIAGIDQDGPAQGRLQLADAGMAERAVVELDRGVVNEGCPGLRGNWLTKRACAARSHA